MTDTTVNELAADAAEAEYHTVLELWAKVLAPARTERHKQVTPQWASRIVNAFTGIAFRDMPAYRDLYFEKVIELLETLEAEIDLDDEALNHTSPEEDAEHNAMHYLNVLLLWQKQVLQWELDWDPTADNAAIDMASISEVHKMFFAEQGLTSLLDQIKFEFTDDHRDLFAAELQAMRDERDGQ
jgi:hypothetical protein